MIPFLLNKTKSLPTLVSDTTAGIGEITGAYEGVAVEEGNGIKELSFKLPIDSPRYAQISVGSYIKAKADEYHGLQIYEIYRITKPINGIVTIYAQHISYILGKATVKPLEATGITQTTQKMIQNLIGAFPFTFSSDIVNTQSSFKLDVPMSFRKAIGGWKGSILDVFGGELDWDNLDVHLYAHRGQDRGVRVEYGKNLTSLTQEESIANVYDAVVGYAVINEVTYVGDIQKITTTDSPRTQNVDFSGSFSSDEQLTPEQIKTRLNTLALAYAQNNDIGKPKVNLRISFEPLSKFEEYKDIALLEQTGLFDTVYVLFPKLGVEAKAKIIKTEYDFINEKMLSVELGDAKTNLLGLVDEQIESQISDMDIDVDVSDIEEAIGFLDEYVENLSQIITNGLGLFFTKVQLVGGGYQYFLHDEPQLSNSMNQWTINAGGFALSTDGGQTWTAGIDAQGNAVLNSLSTIVLKALQIYGSYIQGSEIVFGDPDDPNGKYITAKPYPDGNVSKDGVTFDGSGSVRFQPQNEFIVRNVSANDDLYNYLSMNHQSNQNKVLIENYWYDDPQYLANYIQLISNTANNALSLVNKQLNSEDAGNRLTLNSSNSLHAINVTNYKRSSTDTANNIIMQNGTTNSGVWLYNYQYSNTNLASYMSAVSTSSSNSYTITNNNFGGNTSANKIALKSDTANSLELLNYNSSGTLTNSIIMDSAETNTIWSIDDLRLRSGGAVRIVANYNTSNGQDIYLDAKTLKMIFSDKLSFYPSGSEQGARYNLVIPSLSVGSTGNLQVTRIN